MISSNFVDVCENSYVLTTEGWKDLKNIFLDNMTAKCYSYDIKQKKLNFENISFFDEFNSIPKYYQNKFSYLTFNEKNTILGYDKIKKIDTIIPLNYDTKYFISLITYPVDLTKIQNISTLKYKEQQTSVYRLLGSILSEKYLINENKNRIEFQFGSKIAKESFENLGITPRIKNGNFIFDEFFDYFKQLINNKFIISGINFINLIEGIFDTKIEGDRFRKTNSFTTTVKNKEVAEYLYSCSIVNGFGATYIEDVFVFSFGIFNELNLIKKTNNDTMQKFIKLKKTSFTQFILIRQGNITYFVG